MKLKPNQQMITMKCLMSIQVMKTITKRACWNDWNSKEVVESTEVEEWILN